MKKILLTIIYPFWFFFSLTIVGIFMLFIFSVSIIPIIINYNLPTQTYNDSLSLGFILQLLSPITWPIILWIWIIIYYYLKENYEKYNYKTELEETFDN